MQKHDNLLGTKPWPREEQIKSDHGRVDSVVATKFNVDWAVMSQLTVRMNVFYIYTVTTATPGVYADDPFWALWQYRLFRSGPTRRQG